VSVSKAFAVFGVELHEVCFPYLDELSRISKEIRRVR
jgi:hypothetical protein